jgi:hypothetical protein
MCPIDIKSTATAGEIHPNPIVGKSDHTHAMRIDTSAVPAAYVDTRGYLKAGTPFRRGGLPITAPAQVVFGVVVETVRIHTNNTTLAATTRDIDVALMTIGQVNRKILEDSIGRVLTADELAAFDAAGSTIKLLY